METKKDKMIEFIASLPDHARIDFTLDMLNGCSVSFGIDDNGRMGEQRHTAKHSSPVRSVITIEWDVECVTPSIVKVLEMQA